MIHAHSNSFLRLSILLTMLVSLLGRPGFVTPAQAAITTFGTGSLIIPMDSGTNGQDNGMLRAYGLVYDLLKHGVPVYWVINPDKSANGNDFVVSLANSLQDVRTSATLAPRGYRGGPFIIDSSNSAAALPIIQAWQATAGDATAVHRLIGAQSINPDVSRLLVSAPRIAILADGNEQIAFNNLNAAGIPDSTGDAWSASSPDALTELEVEGPTTTNDSDGALFYQPSGLTRYCYFASMHYNSTSHTSEVVAETRTWLGSDPSTHAYMQCEAARVFENDVNGKFLTNAGLDDDGAATSNPMNRMPWHPLTQIDGTFEVDSGAVDSMRANDAPGATPDYKTGVTTLINDNASTLLQRITLLSGRLDGDSDNGRVTYLAGHDYALDLPISSNPQTNGVRIFLNSIFEADCATVSSQPDVTFTLSAPAIVNNNTIQYTLDYANPGPRPVENVRITDPLPAGATYVSGSASIPPTSNSGGTLTWDLPTLDSGESGSLTFSVNVTVNGVYQNSALMQFSHLAVRVISSNTTATTRDVVFQNTVLDNFNRPNGGVGVNWMVAIAQTKYKIYGSKLDVQLGGALVWKPIAFGVNQEAFVTLATIDPRSSWQGLMLKVQKGSVPTSGAILVAYDARTQTVHISTWKYSVRTNYSAIAAIFVNGDQLGALALADGTLGIYQNGSPIATVTLTPTDQAFFNTRGGRIGLWNYNAPKAFLDDFGGGNVNP